MRLLRRLGAGGMGETWLAEDARGRRVAVKRILPHLANDPAFIARFRDEAKVGALLQHRNLVRTLELTQRDGQWELVTEYVEGKTLAALTNVPAAVLAQLAMDLCAGLHAAHTAKDGQGRPLAVVHRDVSAQNVLVGFDGLSRLFDFGISSLRTKATGPGAAGTLRYFAPELLRDDAVATVKSDQFALAAVLWELLAGRPLRHSDDEVELLEEVERNETPKLLGSPLEQALRRALSSDPGQRFENVAELGEAVRRATAGEHPSHAAVAAWLGSRFGTPENFAPAARAPPAASPASPSRRALTANQHSALARLSGLSQPFTADDAETVLGAAAIELLEVLAEAGAIQPAPAADDGALRFRIA